MDVQKLLQGTKQNLLNEIDKKVTLKTYKDGNKQKTCLSGLDDFITATEKKTQTENIESYTKEIRKSLGCSGTIMKDDNEKIHIIFSGDHIQNIKKSLIKKGIDEKFIKC